MDTIDICDSRTKVKKIYIQKNCRLCYEDRNGTPHLLWDEVKPGSLNLISTDRFSVRNAVDQRIEFVITDRDVQGIYIP